MQARTAHAHLGGQLLDVEFRLADVLQDELGDAADELLLSFRDAARLHGQIGLLDEALAFALAVGE